MGLDYCVYHSCVSTLVPALWLDIQMLTCIQYHRRCTHVFLANGESFWGLGRALPR
jgi:hypothetical protein